ncbi:hypothetical protein AU512_11435 [Lonsdalea iberica]|uniref:Uncharacterized protein n=1 Tax=Lonsdalea iberica TaxID=1082703 RepID=A0ABX3XEB7_9GAMM|nr:hypothetical protein AU512_11435 [Lonsdalea iberica]
MDSLWYLFSTEINPTASSLGFQKALSELVGETEGGGGEGGWDDNPTGLDNAGEAKPDGAGLRPLDTYFALDPYVYAQRARVPIGETAQNLAVYKATDVVVSGKLRIQTRLAYPS